MTQIKILLVGCGSVGTMAAYTLQNSKNADVTVVLRSNYADVLAEGFTIDSVDHGKIDHWTPNHGMSHVDSKLDCPAYVMNSRTVT
jgi:ketopantoate reductase